MLESKLTRLSIAVFGNTTCPATDLVMTRSHLDALDHILVRYGAAISPFHLCPLPLFAEIIRINDLRRRCTKKGRAGADLEDLSQGASEILQRIHGFSPEQWARSKPASKDDWILVGRTYQVAVELYCISSSQSLSILPKAPCPTQSRRLRVLLDKALAYPQIKRFMLWPLVVLGVEAVNGGPALRAFAADQLSDLSRHVGTSSPLIARDAIESFWASGQTCWDACFDRPYAFTMQIAVDTSGILPV